MWTASQRPKKAKLPPYSLARRKTLPRGGRRPARTLLYSAWSQTGGVPALMNIHNFRIPAVRKRPPPQPNTRGKKTGHPLSPLLLDTNLLSHQIINCVWYRFALCARISQGIGKISSIGSAGNF